MVAAVTREPLVGSYVLHETLGRGGMGVVYRATNRLSAEVVALKRLVADLEEAPSAWRSFDLRVTLAREFQTLASLHHPHIIGVRDYGFDTEGSPYFTMEMLPSPTSIVAAAAGCTPDAKIELLVQLLQALAYLHRRNIVHRDVKPSNVLVVDGRVKVVDFGIAVAKDVRGVAAGTIEYMAPEILLGEAPSMQSDLYSAGVIAFELFTGRCPHDSRQVTQFLQGVLGPQADLTLPGEVAALLSAREGARHDDVGGGSLAAALERFHVEGAEGLDEPLRAILRKLLAPTREARYATATEVIDDLSKAQRRPLAVETLETRESFLQAAEFVGRDQELRQLAGALAGARAGKGGTWLVGGESGVGKSRLLDELRTLALVDGTLVVRGQAATEAGRRHQVWVPMVRTLCLCGEVEGDDASVLKDVVGDLATLLGRPIADPPPVAPQAAQARLFATIERVLRRQRKPLLVILEDLQWAASDSLALLGHLTRIVAELPILIVGSYRDDERRDLAKSLPEAKELKLERLPEASIARLSESMLGAAGKERIIVDYLLRETEGNVFFLVEVVRALAEEAGQLDRVGEAGVSEPILTGGMERILQRRLDRIAGDGRALLQLAATGGRQLDLRVLQVASGESDLGSWLRACANAAVLETQDGQWRFSHDKLREYVLARTSPDQARAFHRRIAEALETVYRGASEKDSELAYHYRRAEIPEKACEYFTRAGDAAAKFFVLAEARAHYLGALEALAQLPDTEENRRRKADTLVQVVSASWWSATPEQTLAHMADAESIVRSIPPERLSAEDSLRLARIQYWTGRGHHVRGNPNEAVTCYEKGMPAAREHGDEALWVSMASAIGQSLLLQGHFDRCRPYLEETIAPFEKVANWGDWVRAVGYLGISTAARGEYEAGLAQIQRAFSRAREIKHATYMATNTVYFAMTYLLAEDWPRVIEVSCETVRLASQAGDKLLVYLGHRFVSWGEAWLGHRDVADESLARATSIAQVLGKVILNDWYAVADADFALHFGRAEDALTLATQALATARACGGVFAEGLAHRTCGLALLKLGAKHRAEADRHFAESVKIHEGCGARVAAAATQRRRDAARVH